MPDRSQSRAKSPDRPRVYLLDSVEEAADLRRSLDSRLRFDGRETQRDEVRLDTFDWRLFRDGGSLIETREGRRREIAWRDLDGNLRYHLNTRRRPAFAEDLPAGAFRTALEPVTEMRRLLPLVRLQAVGQELRLLNEDEKTVAWILFEEVTVSLPGRRPRKEPPRFASLRLRPVKGYRSEWSRLIRLVEGKLHSEPAGASDLERALAAIGRQAVDYSSKLTLVLEPEMSAATATREILAKLLDTMVRNQPGLTKRLDSEFLHDFRVAGRRTRSALGQIREVLPAAALERFRPEFAWLGRETGPLRDLDVYLLRFDDYAASLPPETRGALEPLRTFLEDRQRQEHRRLVEILDSERYRRLVAEWRTFLESWPAPEEKPEEEPEEQTGGESPPGEDDETELPRAEPANAGRPVAEVASEQIFRVYRRILKRGRKVDDTSPADDLHRLRIDCKKLRYLLEFFRSLYEPREIELPIKALKRLQDNLGDFNDLTVQQGTLHEYAREMAAEGYGDVETILAMGFLIDGLARRQARERQRFAERFKEFAGRRNRARFKALFGPVGGS